ncbi:hypothetical protein NCCP2222_19620 [Sporosarcina sp. NCCP-2222]|uniref:OB-fold putative lipoprotein n=1 Tax=Sporosarcina sp. NCCP-2222 TaxID=2935073 RepID=UPI00208D553F|nr:OB-fold putative lipoprotein [Sporosarcina sp. NCCP-2222]GKV56015.1 hypothetical protein NCCP2222_19620 [Sporosarcina sp. NCCP-2222]
MDVKEKKPFYKKWWVWLIAAAFLGAIINWGTVENTEENIDLPKKQETSVKGSQDKGPFVEESSATDEVEKQDSKTKPNEKVNKVEKQEEVIVVSMMDLYNAYQDNEVAADLKYKNKSLEVTGVISDFGVDAFGTAFIKFDTGRGPFHDTQVFFKKGQEEKIAELSKGETITIVGKGGGLIITSVVINKAELK